MKQKLLNFIYKILGFFAKHYIKRHKPYVIGITGSIGKTSCRMIIYQMLKKYSNNSFKIYSSPKNFNGEYGLSLSVLGIEDYVPNIFGLLQNLIKGFFIGFFGKKKYDIIILEYGIDHPREMDFLLNIVRPNISIITSIDKVHSMNFENLDQLAKEKLKLALSAKEVVFLNYDNEYTRQIYDNIKIDKFLFRISDKKIDYFSSGERIKDVKPDIWFDNYEIKGFKLKVFSEADVFVRNNKYHVKTNLILKENIGYIGVGLAILEILSKRFKFDKIDNNLTLEFNLQPGRFSIFEGINDSIIIDSSYNAAPGSMRKIIENVYNLKKYIYPDYMLILVLGDMRELGEFSEQEHRKLAGFVSQVADTIFLVGPMMKKYFVDELEKVGYSGFVKWFENSRILGDYLVSYLENLKKPSILVFKGSQNTIFLEEAIKFVLKDTKHFKNLPRQDKKWEKIKEKFFSH